MLVLQEIGAYLTLALGVMGILSPRNVEKFVSVKAIGSLGTSELRATYGGFFFGIAIFALYSGNESAYFALGFGWLCAASVRATTLIAGSFSTKNLGGVVFESVIGFLCISSIST